MSDRDDIEVLAAEYALGTLDAGERNAVAARRHREPALEAALDAWELRFGPLAETVPSVAPPASLFAQIEARIAATPVASFARPSPIVVPAPPQDAIQALVQPVAPDTVARPSIIYPLQPSSQPETGKAVPAEAAWGEIVQLRRSVRFWRVGTIGLGALAACLAVGFGLREFLRPAMPKSYVAVLQKDPASTAFLLSVNLETRAFTIRPVTAQAQPGKSFELWLVDSKLGAKSLGVVGDQAFTTRANLSAYDRVTIAGATYAITLEPAGGSPTGAATGPIVFTGQLVQTTQ